MSMMSDAGDWIAQLTGTAVDAGLQVYQTAAQRDIGVASAQAQGMAAANTAAISAQTEANKSKTVMYVGAAVIIAALFLRQTRGA